MKHGAKTQAIKQFLAANPEAGPAAIVAGLAAQGIKVKPGLASAVKYSKPRGKRSRPSIRAAAQRRTRNGSITVEQLLEVKKPADTIGGAQVRSALDALERLR